MYDKFARPLLLKLSWLVVDAYIWVFARPGFRTINDLILRLALHARGYNNFSSDVRSGELAFIKMIAMKSPQFCVDVGANTGQYSRRLLERTSATVIAFEPLGAAYEALLRLKEQHPDRLICVNKGLADQSGILSLSFGDGDSEYASFSTEVNQIEYVGSSNINSVDVGVTTLDEYLFSYLFADREPSQIDLLKIDTEGFEIEVLQGSKRTISELRPCYVQVEFNWHQLFRNQNLITIASLLPGYQVYQLLPRRHGLVKRDPKKPESNIYHFSNFIFVRDDISV